MMIPLNTTQREKIADIINKGLSQASFNFSISHITKEDIHDQDFLLNKKISIKPEKINPIVEICKNISKNRFNDTSQFYKFSTLERAEQIISTKSIQVSNLISNDENDFAEYSQFYKVIGDKQLFMDARDNIFIFCFTKNVFNQKFWEEYACSDSGIALGFKFQKFNNEFEYSFEFRDVFYDNGYDFDFINYINYHLLKEFGMDLFINGIHSFAKFYKRERFKWEQETRLCLDYSHKISRILLDKYNILINTDCMRKERKFLNIPLISNPVFDLTISEVVCGKYVSQKNYLQIEQLLRCNFPDAILSQRT